MRLFRISIELRQNNLHAPIRLCLKTVHARAPIIELILYSRGHLISVDSNGDRDQKFASHTILKPKACFDFKTEDG